MRSTGPILAVGGITMVNESVVNGQPINWKVPVGTALSVGFFTLLEHAWQEGAVMLAWTALIAVLFVRLNPKIPAPAESFAKWMGH